MKMKKEKEKNVWQKPAKRVRINVLRAIYNFLFSHLAFYAVGQCALSLSLSSLFLRTKMSVIQLISMTKVDMIQ